MTVEYPALIIARIPISELCLKLSVSQIAEVARLHGMSFNRHIHIESQRQALSGHKLLAKGCTSVCSYCDKSLKVRKLPLLSLTNYLWIGDVPMELQGLSYAEKLLVARVRHNRCVVRVQAGSLKMAANAISFANPMPETYATLPPPLADLDSKDLRRTPLLNALEWLKLNHESYADLNISYENLQDYPISGCPLVYTFRKSNDPQPAEALAGACSFTVHGLPWNVLKSMNKKILGIGHRDEPESIYHNTHLYPQMFPWLFPYGKGSFDQPAHAGRWMLMYYDKRFQLDAHFPLIAMNHEQIMKSNFANIAKRLADLDVSVLEELSRKIEAGVHVKDRTTEEQLCFQVMNELDLVAHRVQGSATSKKFMRNEIWSLIEFLGAPSWFITFTPADILHPLCLYFADTKTEFKPEICMDDTCRRLIADNPCVLGVDSKDLGLFGKTIAYYGTVEQQGRLTLHLHLLLWIQAAFTPQEIRDKLMSEDGAFQKRMVEYLESSHQGEFMKGTSDTVWRDLNERESQPGYVDPLQVLPTKRDDWWRQYESTVDEILLKSNMHVCQRGRCFSGDGSCKARFPRDVYSSTMLDPETGALNMKKGESNMNTFSYIMSFLLRCNHNVTSLLSGTALKAVVAYVTEYVTKTGLKTYQIFDVIKSVFDRNDAMHGGTFDRQENARKLMTQVVNALTSKMEMGGPMASMYLLNNPDHYTGHTFVRCWWKNYTRWVMTQWDPLGNDDPMMDDEEDIERVIVRKKGDKYILHSTVDDYQYRPVEFEEVSLYSWVRLMDKSELSAAKKKKQAALDAASADIDIDNISDIDGHESDADSANDASASDHENVATAHVRSTVPQSQGQFIKEHPDKKSHTVKMLEDDGSRVPMFLGGALPRHDHGDREDYCMTMLTLFKPWRTGLDLKAENVNWNDTFASHDFNENALDKMKFFNTKTILSG
ncbi:hypothetical protein FIBSPDRAFT_912483 [Athelia psychrophila]|uniref:Uncharacterized protein n=2 Tax=Athelia psychrophila TaxID=1759441 RepID=A0A166EAS3_9AGAM|nr:hypothetical protein FIBSPDRAFT_912483 [Fibularhizoctonia sp. CBS 109695]